MEKLCSEQGLGRKYGAPRRTCQEQVRTIMARTSTAVFNIEDMLSYHGELLALYAAEENRDLSESERSQIEVAPKFTNRLRMHRVWAMAKGLETNRTADTPSYMCEVLGSLQFVVAGTLALANHLQAFKPRWADKHKAQTKVVENFCVVSEKFASVEDGVTPKAVVQKENLLKEDVIVNMLGAISNESYDLFPVGVEKVEKQANETYKQNLPDFMKDYLVKMKTGAEAHRQGNCRDLRTLCTRMREEVLLDIATALLSEFSERNKSELTLKVAGIVRGMAKTLAIRDEERLDHEKRLTPSLANPTHKKKLIALCKAEDERHASAMAEIKKRKAEFADAITCAGVEVSGRFHLLFKKAIDILDSVPLATHFGELPGDEASEQPRMSMRRRLRRLQDGRAELGKAIEVDPEVLTERKWEGLPTNLWKYDKTDDGFWATETADERLKGFLEGEKRLVRVDPENGEVEDDVRVDENRKAYNSDLAKLYNGGENVEELKEFPTIDSFRSEVHKDLFRSRNIVYAAFVEYFNGEVVAGITKDLKARLEKEVIGDRNWKNMVEQLQSGGD